MKPRTPSGGSAPARASRLVAELAAPTSSLAASLARLSAPSSVADAIVQGSLPTSAREKRGSALLTSIAAGGAALLAARALNDLHVVLADVSRPSAFAPLLGLPLVLAAAWVERSRGGPDPAVTRLYRGLLEVRVPDALAVEVTARVLDRTALEVEQSLGAGPVERSRSAFEEGRPARRGVVSALLAGGAAAWVVVMFWLGYFDALDVAWSLGEGR